MIARRTLLAALGGSLPLHTSVLAQPGANDTDDRDPALIDRWMQRWIDAAVARDGNARKAANGALHVGRFADPIYYLVSLIGWEPNADQAGRYPKVRVPIGFVTDFASVPRIFWTLLPPDGLYTYPAIIHDYLYWDQSLPRETCDEILKLAMEDFKVDSLSIAAVYAGVRAGGAVAWAGNAKAKADGEKRILRTVPTDPTVRWADWKARPDVF